LGYFFVFPNLNIGDCGHIHIKMSFHLAETGLHHSGMSEVLLDGNRSNAFVTAYAAKLWAYLEVN
jgi:hypothetical protein